MIHPWDSFRLKHLARNVIERAAPHDDRPYIGLDAIAPWTGEIDLSASGETEESTGNRFNPGDILFGKLRPYLAKVSAPKFAGQCSAEALVLRPKPHIDPRFLRYRLVDVGAIDAVNASTYGAKMPRASWDFIGNMRFSIPDLSTQKAIADFLDRETARIDQLIEKKVRLVSLAQEGERAHIAHKFLALDAPKWRVRHLGKLKNGAGFPIEFQGDSSQDIAFFKVKHLKTHGLDAEIIDTSDTVSDETARALRAAVFSKGTIVFAKIGAALLLGRFTTLGRPACIDNNMSAFIPNERLIEPNYALLGLSQIDMTTMVQPGAVPSLNTEAFYNFAVPLPSKEMQHKFVDEFRSWRSKILQITEKTQCSIARLQEFRAALITAAVTGQIDVTRWNKRGQTDRQLDVALQETMS